MPIYEYACQKCGTHFEVMQKISDDPLKKHESCGGKLEKQWSQTSFQLKGSGWYVTDYAGKKSGETTDAKTDATVKADAGDESKSKETDSPSADTKTETPKVDGKKDDVKKDVGAKSETKSDAKPASSAAKESKKK